MALWPRRGGKRLTTGQGKPAHLAGRRFASGLRPPGCSARPGGEGSVRRQRPAGAARSFWATAFALPAFLCLRLLSWWRMGCRRISGIRRRWTAYLYRRLAGLCGAIAPAGRRLGAPRMAAFHRAVELVQRRAIPVPGSGGPPVGSRFPDWVNRTTGLVALGWALWLEWFSASQGAGYLRSGGGRACCIRHFPRPDAVGESPAPCSPPEYLREVLRGAPNLVPLPRLRHANVA